MDTELLNAIKEMFDDRFGEIDKRFEKMDSRFEQIDSRFDKIENKMNDGFKNVDSRFEKVENKLNKNTVILEEVKKNITTLAELHEAHGEQNERSFHSINDLINEKSDLIETALTNTTRDMNDIKEDIDVLTEAVGTHDIKLRMLKKRM